MAQTNFTAADMPGARVAVKPVVAPTPTPEPAKKVSSTPAKSAKKVEAEAEVETPAAETE
jgi:hypothetical protein